MLVSVESMQILYHKPHPIIFPPVIIYVPVYVIIRVACVFVANPSYNELNYCSDCCCCVYWSDCSGLGAVTGHHMELQEEKNNKVFNKVG